MLLLFPLLILGRVTVKRFSRLQRSGPFRYSRMLSNDVSKDTGTRWIDRPKLLVLLFGRGYRNRGSGESDR